MTILERKMSMGNNDKIELFEKIPVNKAILTLAIPTIMSSLVMVIYNLADTYFVGMLNNSIQNAAVALAAPVLLAFNAVNNLFGVGSSSLMSRALGKKDYDMVHKSSAIGFYCALFFAAIISILCLLFSAPLLTLLGANDTTATATYEYLKWTVVFGAVPAILNVVLAYLVRAEGSSLHASVGTMSGCLLNIILDPIFILPWGFNMGAAGAGLATFLSNCFACMYFFILLHIKRNNTFVSIKPSQFSLNKVILLAIFAVGIPAAIQNLLNVTGMTILNNLTSSFGTDAVASMGISQKIYMVPTQIALGFSQGVMPLISYNYASGNVKRMKDTLFGTIKITMIFLIAVTLGYIIKSDFLIQLFMSKVEIIEIGSKMLRGFSLGIPFLAMDFIAVGVFQAVGKGKEALLFAILRKVILEIPALLILNNIYPLYGLSYAQFCAEVVLSITAIFVLLRMFKQLIKKNPVKD